MFSKFSSLTTVGIATFIASNFSLIFESVASEKPLEMPKFEHFLWICAMPEARPQKPDGPRARHLRPGPVGPARPVISLVKLHAFNQRDTDCGV